jgi:hypothetical protein
VIVANNLRVGGNNIQDSGGNTRITLGATNLVSGDLRTTGQLIVVGTATVQGNSFSVGGSTLVVVAGNVGIGTTSPGAKLDVRSGASGTGSYALRISTSTDGAGTSVMCFRNDGNVGIGTTNPSRKFSIYGDVLITDVSDTSALSIIPASSFGNFTRAIRLRIGGGSGGADGFVISSFDDTSKIISFSNSTGNVGIGTTNPGSPLEIMSTNDAILRLRQTGGGWNYIEYYNDTVRTLWMGMATDSLFGINGQVYLNTSNGNVGIGTTGPNYKLEVGGTFGGTFDGTNTGQLKVGYTSTSPAGYYAVYAP